MMRLLWFCAAGYSLWVGVGLLLCATMLPASDGKPWYRSVLYTLCTFAALLIFLSATPLPVWFYMIWISGVLAFVLICSTRRPPAAKYTSHMRILAATLSVIVVPAELPYQLTPAGPEGKFEKLYVIGDSVSSGTGRDEERTWPTILREDYGISVVDLSKPGATVASAIGQNTLMQDHEALVLLEIGGNDILQSTPLAAFAKELELLIGSISQPGRAVVMFELPLYPWQSGYGRAQRRLAREMDVVLIPKRFFVRVLAKPKATLDLAHLSPEGHQIMAKTIWSLLGDSMVPTDRIECDVSKTDASSILSVETNSCGRRNSRGRSRNNTKES